MILIFMSIHVIPEMSPEELEKVLKHLPEPTYAEVSLFGDFDYSDISHQAQEVVKGAALQTGGGLTFRLEDVSKEKILDIYRKSHGLNYPVQPAKIQGLSVQEAFTEGEKERMRQTGELYRQRRIDLHKVVWSLDDHVKIELTPWEVNARYRNQEPDYISQMRQELAGTTVRLGIEVNK